MIKTLFDNLNEFSAGDFATVNKQLYDNGVICPSGETTIATTALKVTNSSGNASIGNGSALIKGRVITVSGETVTLATNGTYKIVLEWSAASDGSQLIALSGSATLVQTDTLYQILLATVAKSGASLTITDARTYINKLSGNTALSIQTVPVAPTAPIVGQVLAYDGTNYKPSTIIESGSNANGTYIKFADGTMICTGSKLITMDCVKAWGNMYETAAMDFLPYPMAFTSVSHVAYTNIGQAAFIENGGMPSGQTALTIPKSIYFVRPVSLLAGAFAATYEAIGRWKS